MISTDPARRAGFTSDPAETDGWCAWLRLRRASVYLGSGLRFWLVRS